MGKVTKKEFEPIWKRFQEKWGSKFQATPATKNDWFKALEPFPVSIIKRSIRYWVEHYLAENKGFPPDEMSIRNLCLRFTHEDAMNKFEAYEPDEERKPPPPAYYENLEKHFPGYIQRAIKTNGMNSSIQAILSKESAKKDDNSEQSA